MATPAGSTPRISAAYLESFQGTTIRLLGRVVSLRGETAVIDAGGEISLQLPRDAHVRVGNAVEVVGKVQNDLSVRAFAAVDFGVKIDFAAVDAVVDATHRYKSIFYGDD